MSEQPETVVINVNMLLCTPVELTLEDILFAISQGIGPTGPEGAEESNCAKCDRKVRIGKHQQKYCHENPDEYWVLCFSCGAQVMANTAGLNDFAAMHINAQTGERRDG